MALLEPPLALLLSVIIIIILVFRKMNVSLALLIGAMLYGVMTLGFSILEATADSFNLQMAQTLAALILSMLLASLYSSSGVSRLLMEGLKGFGPSFAAISTPAVIGLLPMPGGAYVSAVIVDPLYTEMGLKSHVKTFLNYWFRHIWITTWPLYQGVILASGILNIPVDRITMINIPITMATLLSGIIMSHREMKNWKNVSLMKKEAWKTVHIWPFAVIAILAVVLKVNLVVSLCITLFLFILFYRPSSSSLINGLRDMLNPTFIGVVIISFIFSNYVVRSNVTLYLKEVLAPYAELAIFLIPLVLVMGTGVEFTFVALAFPPLAPLLRSEERLLLGFLGGFTGAILSPAHACLVFSANYYKAELPKIYKLLVPATMLTLVFMAFYMLVV